MIEKLAKQTAIYGISTILGRMLSYLLTPFYTRIFGVESYGIITDVYALIPFALVVLTMGMESSDIPTCRQGRGRGWRHRAGQAQALCHHVGCHIAGCVAILCGGAPPSQRGFGAYGRGLCRPSALCGDRGRHCDDGCGVVHPVCTIA